MSSVYPGALDSDATLYVAKDNISTKSISPQAIGDTVLVVANPAGWAANMIASIGTEQQFVTGVAGNALNVTRGFGGTVAAAHTNGSVVANNVDAAYQSATKSAIIAIETALGANLSKVVPPFISIAAYNFPQQTPGGTLTGGSPASITLSPVPLGVNGTDTNHYLYVANGIGTAEAVLITGGTAASGSASGTILFTPAFNHSGSWTIQSASSGITEALVANGFNGRFQLPAGTTNLYHPVLIQNCNISLRGGGQGISVIRTNGSLVGDWLFFDNPIDNSIPYIDLGDFTIADATATMHTAGSMIRVKAKAYGLINNIEIENGYDGLIMDTCPGTVTVDSVHAGCQRHAMYITTFGAHYPTVHQSGCSISNVRLANIADACMQIEGPTSTILATNCSFGSPTPLSSNYCLQISTSSLDPSGEITFSNCIFDASGNAVRILGDNLDYGDNWFIFNGCELNGTEAAFFIDGMVQNVYVNGGLIKASGGTLNEPVNLTGASSVICPRNIQFHGVSVYGTGAAAFNIENCINLVIDGVPVGNEGSGPLTFLTIKGTVSAFIQGCDFTNCTTAKITQSGGASFAAIRVVDFSNSWAFSNLVALANGSTVMVNDGTIANPVANGGTGCLAKRLNGAWVGN